MSLKSKIILNALFGAIGGFLGWAITEQLLSGFYFKGLNDHTWSEIVVANSELGIIVGMLIGGMLGAADGLWARKPGYSQRFIVRGAFAGAIGGFIGLNLGQSVFNIFSGGQHEGNVLPFATMVIGWTISWAFFGAAIGAAQGLAGFSATRAKHGTIGGFVGGGLGGMFFAIVPYIILVQDRFHGRPGRMIGLTAIGFVVGFMIGLMQDLLKPAWVVVMKGNNEGREIPVYKAVMTIGRDELADIPIFEDRTVLARHAVIKQQNNRHVLEDGGTTLGTSINGQKIASHMLKDRDIIEIGTVRLLFREKATATRYAVTPDTSRAVDDRPAIPQSAHVCPFCGGVKDANGNCECTVASDQIPAPGLAPTQQMAPPTMAPPAPTLMTAPPQPMAPPAPTMMNAPPQPMVPGPVPRVGRLVAVSGPHASMVFALQTAEVSIGREAGRDIYLPNDTAASRRHARVVREDQGFVLYDEGSSNGTFVNGGRITRAVLNPGDMITIGGTEMRFEV